MPEKPRPLGGAELFTLHTHLNRFTNHACPVCGTKSWSPLGISYRHTYDELNGALGRPVPVALLACNRCFYIREFAWMPILATMYPTAEGGGVGE